MNLSAFSAAPCSLKFSDMATPLVDGCRDASIVSPNGVATHTPMHTVKPGSARQGQVLRRPSRVAAPAIGCADNGADSDLQTQRPAAGTQIHEGAIHGAKH